MWSDEFEQRTRYGDRLGQVPVPGDAHPPIPRWQSRRPGVAPRLRALLGGKPG